MDNNLDFLEQKKKNVFQELEKEQKESKKNNNESNSNQDFIDGLPDWDLVPPNESVNRVVRM